MKYRIFRYGYSSIMMILGLVLSFLVFSFYTGVKHEENQEIEDSAELKRSNEMYVMAVGNAFDLNSIDCSAFENVDVSVTGVEIYVNEDGYCHTGDVVLTQDELVYPVVKGGYPTKEELLTGENVVVLGQQLRPLTEHKNGNDYIVLCGDEYRVTGYLGCKSSTVIDYSIIVYGGSLGDGLRKNIKEYGDSIGYNIIFQSDSMPTNQMREQLQVYFDSEDYYFNEMMDSPKIFATRYVSKENKEYAILTYIFSVVIAVLVVEYWLICKKKEFAIRKAFGYTSDRLAIGMIIEIVLYLAVSILLSEVILAIFNLFEKRAVVFMLADFWKRFVDLIKYIGITISVVLIRPMYKIYKDNPINMLVDKENS